MFLVALITYINLLSNTSIAIVPIVASSLVTPGHQFAACLSIAKCVSSCVNQDEYRIMAIDF